MTAPNPDQARPGPEPDQARPGLVRSGPDIAAGPVTPTVHPIEPDDRDRLGGFVLDLGLRRLPAPEDELVFELDCMPYRSNSSGFLHGGMMATLVDCTAGLLAYEGVDDESMTTTTNLSVNYLAPVRRGPARATARILRRGRKIVVVQVEVHDADSGDLCSVSLVTYVVVCRLPGAGGDIPPAHPEPTPG